MKPRKHENFWAMPNPECGERWGGGGGGVGGWLSFKKNGDARRRIKIKGDRCLNQVTLKEWIIHQHSIK